MPIVILDKHVLERNKIELPDIDVDSEGRRRPLVLQKIKEAARNDGGDSVCVCTFGTLGTRSAILTAARGLGIDVDIAQYLATMIPQERGFLWPLKDCLEGNPEKDRKPIIPLTTSRKPGYFSHSLINCVIGFLSFSGLPSRQSFNGHRNPHS